ncbi:MAG: STAS domain-containing protein [Actinomycetota bacterium]|nr:STAS domain-containing protein [Actinomycetota bacterium]
MRARREVGGPVPELRFVQLQIRKTDCGHVKLRGELDLSNAERLEEALSRELEGDLGIDLSELSFIDSHGVIVIMEAAQKLQGRGRLVLLSPCRTVMKVLEIAGSHLALPNLHILPIGTCAP